MRVVYRAKGIKMIAHLEKGKNGTVDPIYVETWEVVGNSKENILDIAYTRSMCPTVEAADMFRRMMAEIHGCVLCKLLRTRKIELEGE